jgi:hypothetical protein
MIDGFHESKVEGHEKTQSKTSLKSPGSKCELVVGL